ncbi:beta-ketoacyl synthase N-terminal-like domain-containing protein [Mycolicibacterium thermoresistibile]
MLRQRSERYGDKLAFDYCTGEREHSRLTYQDLDIRARAIAATLQRQGAAGERVLVLCPSGLDFIAAMFGCFYVGAVAVPVHPPVHNRLISRVASIVADVRASIVLTTSTTQIDLRDVLDGLHDGDALRWLAVDTVDPDVAAGWVAPDVDSGAVAFVQYTSGSTSTPKGVVLTHRNLLANLESIVRDAGLDDEARVVSWLPLHHDMGLIGGVFGVVRFGGTGFLMPPSVFIQRPMGWLEAISRHGANLSVAPNFGYELCVERSTPEERAALDLSTWVRAYCGAEPVRPRTMQRFADAFAPAGFRPEYIHPVYGLAEATLFVSGNPEFGVRPTIRNLDSVALREHRVVATGAEDPAASAVVGCGQAGYGQEVVIVDPVSHLPCRSDQIGEIWVAGENVAQGYLGKPAESAETFSAFLSDSGRGPFLRTGDYGFLLDGELFVTGRLKDLIIIRGRNYHPNDIEATVQETHPALMNGRGAAFAVTPDSGGPEQLVMIQEVDREQLGENNFDELIVGIRTAITAGHDIQAHTVALVDPLRIPTTSSGKIRRNACRQRFLDGELEPLAQWQLPTPRDTESEPQPEPGTGRTPRSADEIRTWFIAQLAGELGLTPADIDSTQPFAYYGLDSVRAIQLTTALEAWLGEKVPPTLAYDYPSIDLVSEHLAEDAAMDAAVDGGRMPAWEAGADRTAEPIAIIGIGCRFPGADGPSAFWHLLTDGVDGVTETPPERWGAHVAGHSASQWGGFLDQIDHFDAQFFGISPREAALMDPQQRLLLEVTWEALEDGGQVPDRLAGSRTGVFTGVTTHDYQVLQLSRPELIDVYSGTGTSASIAANRLSYFFDFRGPSMTLDSACSSSLVAVHQACRSLRDGECDLALAGGVNVMLTPGIALHFSMAGVMAADGRCKTFDARADGWVRGEGAGIVVLKPLRQALADNDPIYAVIRGSAINQDGRTNGLMAPSRASQEAVLAEAYQRAGVSPAVVQYVEAQGLGTLVGDAIEAQALGTVMADGRPADSPCLVGSVKTNIGHLEAAAGIAGLIKVALALRHRTIPPTLNFTEPNPNIPFDTLPLRVADTLTPWPDNGRAVAGVSAFGFGGSNAHVVLAEAPQVRATGAGNDARDGQVEILPLSARSPDALAALAFRYESALASDAPLADLCHTAGVRRSHHDHRLAVAGGSRDELIAALTAYRQGTSHPGLPVAPRSAGRRRTGRQPGVVFLFPDEGSQWRGMAQQLYAEEPEFRAALVECDRALRQYMQSSPLTELLADPTQSRMDEVAIAAPAIFAVQVALAALWRSWGVQPAAVLGHRLGEVAAAHVAGALSLADAARLICGRTRLLRLASEDAMRDGLRSLLANLHPVSAQIPIYSTVTGNILNGQAFDAAHWLDNLRSPIRFSAAVRRLLALGHETFLELSPHPTLIDAVQEDAAELGHTCTVLTSMRRGECGRDVMLASLAALYSAGHPVDWARVHPHGSHCAATPTYPWQRQRFWLSPTPGTAPDSAPNPAVAATGIAAQGPASPSAGAAPTVDEVLLCADQRERRQLLESYLREQAAAKLGVLTPLLDIEAPLSTLGVDSLMAAELRAQIERDLGIVIPVAQLLNGPNIVGLAEWLSTTMSGFGSARPEAAKPAAVATEAEPHHPADGSRWIDLLSQVPEVSDDDVDELLREVLAAGENTDDNQPH